MAQITIRRLPDEVHRALQAEAAREGISAEEKARRLLTAGLFPRGEMPFGDWLNALARDLDLDDVTFERDRSGIEAPSFE
ncbi:Plasmid stability protein [Fulvimarina manganoxydans]|uniref:Plasmid stability protein n=1 Tax=Fulvimarina manganoxydans TaxID=937218 RepID=A0A1W2C0M2_9HYPH|nr:plasmid stabilization protein [Fulvimarina manganoxydans]MCK5934060.1 plasmid stability protein stbC [Fulvimarina manganoxydans]SMC78641.1 Plasmid stability protein [Fulvimarina manganoxydans]